MSAKGRGWDEKAHEALLLAILDESGKPNKAILTKVAENMQARGFSYSYDAINQHVQKLRKSRDTSTLATEQSGAPTKGNTPRKAATPRKRATPKKKPAETPEAVSDTGDAEKLKFEEASDDEVDMKPMKPAKRSKKKKELEEEVKEEDEEEQTEV